MVGKSFSDEKARHSGKAPLCKGGWLRVSGDWGIVIDKKVVCVLDNPSDLVDFASSATSLYTREAF